MEIPTPFPRFAIFTRYVPLVDTTDSESSQNHSINTLTQWLVSWSLTSLFSTDMAISETTLTQ